MRRLRAANIMTSYPLFHLINGKVVKGMWRSKLYDVMKCAAQRNSEGVGRRTFIRKRRPSSSSLLVCQRIYKVLLFFKNDDS